MPLWAGINPASTHKAHPEPISADQTLEIGIICQLSYAISYETPNVDGFDRQCSGGVYRLSNNPYPFALKQTATR